MVANCCFNLAKKLNLGRWEKNLSESPCQIRISLYTIQHAYLERTPTTPLKNAVQCPESDVHLSNNIGELANDNSHKSSRTGSLPCSRILR